MINNNCNNYSSVNFPCKINYRSNSLSILNLCIRIFSVKSLVKTKIKNSWNSWKKLFMKNIWKEAGGKSEIFNGKFRSRYSKFWNFRVCRGVRLKTGREKGRWLLRPWALKVAVARECVRKTLRGNKFKWKTTKK